MRASALKDKITNISFKVIYSYSTFDVTARDETSTRKTELHFWGQGAFGETGQRFFLPHGVNFPQVGDYNPTLPRGVNFPAPNRPLPSLHQQ